MKLHQSKLTGRQRDKEAATGEREMGEGRVGQHKQPRVGKLLDLGVGYFNQLHRQSNAHSTTYTYTHTHIETITHVAEQNRTEENRTGNSRHLTLWQNDLQDSMCSKS